MTPALAGLIAAGVSVAVLRWASGRLERVRGVGGIDVPARELRDGIRSETDRLAAAVDGRPDR